MRQVDDVLVKFEISFLSKILMIPLKNNYRLTVI